jgi:RIP metalloprotease RseP
MSGENPMDERTGDAGEFLSHPRWQRFIVALAGPAMNIALAIGLLTLVYMVRYERPVFADKPAVIGWVLPNSVASKAGLQEGDRIIRLDGIENPTWEQVEPRVALSPNQPIQLTVLRAGQALEKTVIPEAIGIEQYGSLGWVPDQPNEITDLEPGMPAEKAGLKKGDLIVALNGQPIRAIAQMISMLQKTKEAPVELTVQRGAQQLQFKMQPVATKTGRDRGTALPSRLPIGTKRHDPALFPAGAEQVARRQQAQLVPNPGTAAEDDSAQGLNAHGGRADWNQHGCGTGRARGRMDPAAGHHGGDQLEPRHL